MPSNARRILAAAILATAFPGMARAEEAVPAPLQVAILLKVLVYDRTLAVRAKDGLTLAVVYVPKNAASKDSKEAFVKSFSESARSVAGTSISLVEIPIDALEASAAKGGLDLIYVCEGVDVEKALETARKYALITFAPDQAAVEKGVVIGLVPKGGKPKLLINVGASITAGMQLDPQILRLAELVRGGTEPAP